MSEEKVGEVAHYFFRISVAVLDLSKPLRVGDSISIVGETTDLQQTVTSVQVNHEDVEEAHPGQEVAVKVDSRVRRLRSRARAGERRSLPCPHSQNILCY